MSGETIVTVHSPLRVLHSHDIGEVNFAQETKKNTIIFNLLYNGCIEAFITKTQLKHGLVAISYEYLGFPS